MTFKMTRALDFFEQQQQQQQDAYQYEINSQSENNTSSHWLKASSYN